MPGTLDFALGPWRRFNRYEVREGYVRPAEGAELAMYDPWEDYLRGWAKQRNPVPPYRSLLELVGRIVILSRSAADVDIFSGDVTGVGKRLVGADEIDRQRAQANDQNAKAAHENLPAEHAVKTR